MAISCDSLISDLRRWSQQRFHHAGTRRRRPVGRVALTERGARILQGELDGVALNGIDRSIGGVHLHPGGTDRRYDHRLEALVETAAPS